jgi:transposase
VAEVPKLAKRKNVQELGELQRQKMSIQDISKFTGSERKAIRKYLPHAKAMPKKGPR